MSRTLGAVRFTDGHVLFFVYDGTVCCCRSRLYNEVAEAWADLRNDEANKASCSCAHDEEAEIYSDYGGGFSWAGRACRRCRAITDASTLYTVEHEGPYIGFPPYHSEEVKSRQEGRAAWYIAARTASLERRPV